MDDQVIEISREQYIRKDEKIVEDKALDLPSDKKPSTGGLLAILAMVMMMSSMNNMTSEVLGNRRVPGIKAEPPKNIDRALIEGVPKFKYFSLKKLIKQHPNRGGELWAFENLKGKYQDKGDVFLLNYNRENYACVDALWPNINGSILELNDNTIHFKIPTVFHFTLEMFRRAQFKMFIDLKNHPKFKFGFDTRLLKIEIWNDSILDIKIIYILGHDVFDVHYTNLSNSESSHKLLIRVVDKYMKHLFQGKFHIH